MMENQPWPCCILEWEHREEMRIVIVKFKNSKQHKVQCEFGSSKNEMQVFGEVSSGLIVPKVPFRTEIFHYSA